MKISRCIAMLLLGVLCFAVARNGPVRGAEVSRGIAPLADHERLSRILQEPQFNQWRLREKLGASHVHVPWQKAIGEFFNNTFRAIRHILRHIFGSGHRGASGGNAGGHASIAQDLEMLGVIAVLVLAAIIGLVLLRSWRMGRIKPTGGAGGLPSRQAIEQAMQCGDALAMASDAWLAAAQQFSVDGDFRAMYRAMYLALLAGLHETGKIQFRRQQTNWQYVRTFRGEDIQRNTFVSLTEMFDRVWYGHKEYERVDLENIQSRIRLLIGKGAAHA